MSSNRLGTERPPWVRWGQGPAVEERAMSSTRCAAGVQFITVAFTAGSFHNMSRLCVPDSAGKV
jgi:hypothetical protein